MKTVSDSAHLKAFRGLVSKFLDESWERFPHQASRLGFEKFDSELGDNSPATHRAQSKLAAETLRAVELLPEDAFSGDDWLDRRCFLAMLRTDTLKSVTLERWRNNPQQHCEAAVDAIFDLAVRHSQNLAKALPAIESRLAKLPDFLAAGAACVSKPVPLWTQLAQRGCEGSVEFLNGLEAELRSYSSNPKRTFRLFAAASKAFSDYSDAIGRKSQGAPGEFAVGRERFEFLMRERLGVDWTLPEARANGLRLVDRMKHLFEQEVAKYGRKAGQNLLEQASENWNPGRPLIDEYRAVTASLKGRLASLDFASLPDGESLDVLPVPAFLRYQFPTAAYSAPGPFAKRQKGIFWVNDLSLTRTDPAQAAAEIRQHFGMELTCAHEGYPGHHLQFIVQNRHPSKLRRLADHAIFYEGWTMWCEKMAVERGLVESPHARLQQLHDALWRAYRIVIDCGLHDGALSFKGAAKVLMDGVGFTRARAEGDVNWYTSSPTIPMSYLLGRIEVERLCQRFVGGEGWSLKQFNDWMLSHGAVPWRWIVQARERSGEAA